MSRRFFLKKIDQVVCWAGPMAWSNRVGLVGLGPRPRPRPDPTPLTHLSSSHAHDPPLSLVASLTLQHRRSPRRLPANSGAGEPGVPARLDVLNNLPQVDLIFVASRGRPDPETLASYWSWSPMVSGAAALPCVDLSSSSILCTISVTLLLIASPQGTG
jgi:hypothetical protein